MRERDGRVKRERERNGRGGTVTRRYPNNKRVKSSRQLEQDEWRKELLSLWRRHSHM